MNSRDDARYKEAIDIYTQKLWLEVFAFVMTQRGDIKQLELNPEKIQTIYNGISEEIKTNPTLKLLFNKFNFFNNTNNQKINSILQDIVDNFSDPTVNLPNFYIAELKNPDSSESFIKNCLQKYAMSWPDLPNFVKSKSVNEEIKNEEVQIDVQSHTTFIPQMRSSSNYIAVIDEYTKELWQDINNFITDQLRECQPIRI